MAVPVTDYCRLSNVFNEPGINSALLIGHTSRRSSTKGNVTSMGLDKSPNVNRKRMVM